MPSGVVSWVGQGTDVLDGGRSVKGGALLGMNVGYPIVTNGDFVTYTCVKVHEAIELLFQVVSAVS